MRSSMVRLMASSPFRRFADKETFTLQIRDQGPGAPEERNWQNYLSRFIAVTPHGIMVPASA